MNSHTVIQSTNIFLTGRGHTRLKSLLQKDKSHQKQSPNQNQQLDSASSPPPVTDMNNGTANLNSNSNVDVVYALKPQTQPSAIVPAVPTPSVRFLLFFIILC